jgi:ABC-2 type transport system permease protein
VAPLLLAFVLNLVVGGLMSQDTLEVDFGLVDQDGGELAAAFRSALDELDGLDLTLTDDLDPDAARDLVARNSLDAAFVLPAGLSDDVRNRRETEIQVISDVDAPVASEVAVAVADGFARRVDAVQLSVATALRAGTDTDIDTLVAAAGETPSPVAVVPGEATDRQLDPTTYLIAGLSVLFLFLLVGMGTTSFLDEKREGTMARLLAAPVPRSAVPVAKALSSVALAVIALTVLVISSTLVMGADWGPPAAVIVLGIAAALAATSLMGVVTAVATTPEQANQAQAMVAMVLAILGGSFFPVNRAGDLIGRLTVLTPHHWFLRGLGEASGGGLAAALPAAAALLAFAVVAGGVGALLVSRTVRP